MKNYRIADLSNGPFGETFSTIEAAQAAFDEALKDGFFAEKECEEERVQNGYEPRSDEDITRQVLDFFSIVDAETGEEI